MLKYVRRLDREQIFRMPSATTWYHAMSASPRASSASLGTARSPGVHDGISKEPFHALHLETDEAFAEPLSCSLSV